MHTESTQKAETNSLSDAFVDNLLQNCFVTEDNVRKQLYQEQELVFERNLPNIGSVTSSSDFIGTDAVQISLKAFKTLKKSFNVSGQPLVTCKSRAQKPKKTLSDRKYLKSIQK